MEFLINLFKGFYKYKFKIIYKKYDKFRYNLS